MEYGVIYTPYTIDELAEYETENSVNEVHAYLHPSLLVCIVV